MATHRKGRCVYTQFDKKILCAGSLNKILRIQERTEGRTNPGDDGNPSPVFTLIDDPIGELEAVKYTRRFDGVSMEDQSADNFTHVGYIPFDQDIYELDVNTMFVEIEATRNRRFKLKGIQDYDEEGQWLQLKLAETGFSDLDGAKG